MALSKCLCFISCLLALNVTGQENAAPSIHLVSFFPSSDAVLKMHKIKIVQSAYAEYFEVNSFTNGYDGLQQTPSTAWGSPNILIFSLWDLNTPAGIYSHVDYFAPLTDTGRFGGEGNGYRTIYSYNWNLNTWYNLVNRSWKSHDSLHIAMFINDLSTGSWLHSATLSIPDPGTYLNAYNDAFMENWEGRVAAYDGSFIRAAYFKDAWNLNIAGTWEKNTYATFSANNSAGDVTRDGIYHNSFNAYFDNTEDAYYMQHGGTTSPSPAFGSGRTLSLPAQANQGSAPALTLGAITSVSASNAGGNTTVSWTIDGSKSPQLSAKVEILNSSNNVVSIFEDTMPQRRSVIINSTLPAGSYTSRVTVRDIFNQQTLPVTSSFIVSGPLPLHLLSFDGNQNNHQVELTWTTNNEISTSHFDIEKSSDGGVSFINIGKVMANGNSNTARLYRFTDVKTNNIDRVYYRLRITDLDGNYNYSKVVSFDLSGPERYTISPNPSTGLLHVEGKNLRQISICDQTGTMILRQRISGSQLVLNLSDRPRGAYIVKVMTSDGTVHTSKLILN
jgi:hypothetical protein